MNEEKISRKAVEKKKDANKSEKYFYAVGRRKTSVAQVRIFPEDKAGESSWFVNSRKMKDYFPEEKMQLLFLSPLKEAGMIENFRVSVVVKGGGTTGQVEASRMGIARALVEFDEELRPVLKANGFLKRDDRRVERKKPGLKKARRSPQWSKR
ncbi:MAG: 30S ribosomal protein S9 [Candidatus Moranbacteria bacterium]|jgi:small subunit ribosomal protein S9|nr:30S ribosomal protein S9 [Candidatus Moranbacteria bacterium]MDD5651818.1 30S ribosomal protein S9 [Candidatus Moranbacteria bacterium]MDX9855487.1 30S ribosomal protein S9 [Candidatus Moranbacteria bacterium]